MPIRTGGTKLNRIMAKKTAAGKILLFLAVKKINFKQYETEIVSIKIRRGIKKSEKKESLLPMLLLV